MHMLHRVPVLPDLGIDPHYAVLGAKYLDKSFRAFDEYAAYEPSETDVQDFLGARFDEVGRQIQADSERPGGGES